MLTVFLHAWLTGVMQDGIEFNARFLTGHMKIMTKAYALEKDQLPNDLALTGSNSIRKMLDKNYPEAEWVERIRFGGLLDVSDAAGVTKSQGPVLGISIDLLSGNKGEINRLNLEKCIVQGQMPNRSGEILISNQFATKLKIKPGEQVTLISSTMNGAMAMYNFRIAGTINFGTSALDRGTIVTDLADARFALDMEDASGEILGFFKAGYYNDEIAGLISEKFNKENDHARDDFAPQMMTLRQEDQMSLMLDYSEKFSGIMIAVFIFAMSVVLWNAGLLGGLRRYGEFGLRLAMGETHGHIYRSQIYESLMIGFSGTILGMLIGLGFAWLVQVYGFDASGMMKNAAMMMPSTFHARITPEAWYVGFIPGLVSTVLGTLLSGFGIYRRKTSQLFKELET
jgi:putative ABC transport system permease protein